MIFQKILCPVDFSPDSDRAMRVAVRLAKQSGAELVIAHVFRIPSLAYAGEAPLPPDTIERLRDDARRCLAEVASEATRLGAPRVISRLLTGVPWDQIVSAARDDSTFDLVVMGTQGRTGLARMLFGSVAEKVVRHAPCAVLATREGADITPFHHVLCPVDFSDSSAHATELAAQLAEPGGAGITLLHVIELPVSYSGPPLEPTFLKSLDEQAALRLERWAADLRVKVSVPVVTKSSIGGPSGRTLAALDKDPSYDLVVMGSHGRSGLLRVLLGSTAETVVRHASCSVLIARAPAA